RILTFAGPSVTWRTTHEDVETWFSNSYRSCPFDWDGKRAIAERRGRPDLAQSRTAGRRPRGHQRRDTRQAWEQDCRPALPAYSRAARSPPKRPQAETFSR